MRLHNLPHELTVLALPFGNYVDTDNGIRLMTSTWRRNADDALPARGKIVGGYVNMAFQKSEAELNGFDEALVLTPDGHASEASAANMFVVRDGVLLTPPVSDDILEGVTRKAILELAEVLGIPTEIRSIDRSEIYVADEMFLCGTGVQLVAGHRARPPADRRRRHRPDHEAAPRGVLRRRSRPRLALRPLADADPVALIRAPAFPTRRVTTPQESAHAPSSAARDRRLRRAARDAPVRIGHAADVGDRAAWARDRRGRELRGSPR